jgi:uncharacterized membrane protein (DUF106 family)
MFNAELKELHDANDDAELKELYEMQTQISNVCVASKKNHLTTWV